MDYYSQIAGGYDELHGAEQDEKLKEFLQKIELKPGAKLLDVGCGTGRSFLQLRDVDWYGIEPAKGLILQAPKAVQERIALGRGEELPWDAGTFDVVLSLTALQNYDDPKQGIAEMKRVAKSNGIILISFIRKSQRRELLDRCIRSQLTVIDFWGQSRDAMYICRI